MHQSPCPTIMKRSLIIFLAKDTSPMPFIPGSSPTGCLLDEEWMNEWMKSSRPFSGFTPSSVQVRNKMVLWLSPVTPPPSSSDRFAQSLSSHLISPPSLLPSSCFQNSIPSPSLFLTPYTPLAGQAVCPPPLKRCLKLPQFSKCSRLAGTETALAPLPSLE